MCFAVITTEKPQKCRFKTYNNTDVKMQQKEICLLSEILNGILKKRTISKRRQFCFSSSYIQPIWETAFMSDSFWNTFFNSSNKKKCLLWWVTSNIVFLTISTIQLSHVNNVKKAVNNQENQLSNYPRHCRFLQYQHSICQCGWATEAWSENVLQCVALLINYGSATQTQKHKMDHLITCMQAPRTLFWSFRTLIGRLDHD